MSHALRTIERFYGDKPRGIIHIGANKGQEIPDYMESGIRPVVLVEALDEPFDRLFKAAKEESGLYPVKSCLADVAGRSVEFFIASNGGQSSSYYEPDRHLDFYPNVKFDSSVTMVTETLDDVIDRMSDSIDPTSLDYISLDTQGSEVDILKGGLRSLGRARFVYMEVSYAGLYKGSPDLYDVIHFMQSYGFDICNLVMRNKGWGDALFAKKGVIGNV